MRTLGAVPQEGGRTSFRVWAPDRSRVEVCLERGGRLVFEPLDPVGDGYFEAVRPAVAGERYRFRLDGRDSYPDPCSRFQPEGPHGPSVVVDPAFAWTDAAWTGPEARGQVIYELHVGTFTREGTYAAAMERLPYLQALGVTCLELMPAHTFPGKFNWGYDGVDLFAPCAVYGSPDELRRLVDRAHALGLGVILDVVYNHLGPDGNYLQRYAQAYFTDRYPGEWGEPIRFEHAPAVRDFFVQNARMWVSEYHFDGLRLDATQNVFDGSSPHILTVLTAAVRHAGGARRTFVVAESEPQDVRLVTSPPAGGYGADALWVDDFHHVSRVALTGRAEAYVSDYRGDAQELLSCALYNAVFQGQYCAWQQKPRGSRLLDVQRSALVFYLQNHDQVANTVDGKRLHQVSAPAAARALTTFWLLLPQTPTLFMGQEFWASTPFLYFVDHKPELQRAVAAGRTQFLSQFPSARSAFEKEGLRVDLGSTAFEASKLDWDSLDEPEHRQALALHRALLALRRADAAFTSPASTLRGEVLSEGALALRYSHPRAGERLVLLNLGVDLALESCPRPLLCPPSRGEWRPVLSSEETRFGGRGSTPCTGVRGWTVPGQCAWLLTSEENA